MQRRLFHNYFPNCLILAPLHPACFVTMQTVAFRPTLWGPLRSIVQACSFSPLRSLMTLNAPPNKRIDGTALAAYVSG